MKLTGELKIKVDRAKSNEEKKNLIGKAGMVLTDEELKQVTGGCGTVNLVTNTDCDKCGGTELDGQVICTGIDGTNRIASYKCSCGNEYYIYIN